MSEVIDPTTLVVGQSIRFKSLSSHDNVLWSGTIVGITLYSAIKDITDVVPYYKEMLKEDSTLLSLEASTFIQLLLSENYDDNKSRYRYFALNWIDPSTLTIVDVASYTDIRVYDITSDQLTTVLTLLRANGFLCQKTPS